MIHIEVGAEKILSFGHFAITNTLLMSWIVVLFLCIIGYLISKNIQILPARFQNGVELFVDGIIGIMAGVLNSREKAEKYFPFIATLFFIILFSNWFGIIPGVGSIGFFTTNNGQHIFVPLIRSVATDLNFTLALAIMTVIMINLIGIRAIGLGSHISKYISFKSPISFFIGILEIISEFAKMVSFSFRLFGNIFAGEVLLIITSFLIPYVIPVPFLILEVFVGIVQALVFAMLALVFISIAIEHHA